jgi:hypothetical protein
MKHSPLAHYRLRPSLAAAFFLAAGLSASADQRRFAFTYPAGTSPKGAIEWENTVTWGHRVGEDKKYDLFEFKHSVEIGVTDHFQVELYPASWTYDTDRKSARYEESAIEAIYNLTNPTTSWLGSALYLELAVGERAFDIESKVILQKNLGPITVGYNAILEAEWEGDRFGHFDTQNGAFSQTLGVSYEVTKSFSVGAELVHEVALPDWRASEPSVVYAGPNASVRFSRGYVTVAGVFQLTSVKEEPEVQTRVIFGVSF